ncbi:helix-turn-helix domain-containing protein [Dyella sp. Tek66A03]|uniref:helix-turn-helix domain-containing protein n=1 Tax=Dyella sp. Tek66A03 TaxID=3458298 RepID=UPI00403EF31E
MREVQVKIVIAMGDGVAIDLAVLGGQRRLALRNGERLLVNDAPSLNISGPARCCMLDLGEALRLIAFLDHGRGIERRDQPITSSGVALRVIEPIEKPAIAVAWLIRGLARADPGVEALAASLMHSERYQLIRFVLAESGTHGVAELAARYGLSPAQFYRKCKQVLGRSLKRELRLLRAGRALLSYSGRKHTFTRVAADNGYASPSHFCAEIKALIGVSPREVYQAIAPDLV